MDNRRFHRIIGKIIEIQEPLLMVLVSTRQHCYLIDNARKKQRSNSKNVVYP